MKPRLIAYYLPQYHQIPENDAWWGEGFTEWTNVTKAKPLYKGHIQPLLPADFGFYNLLIPEVREMQSEYALEYGIESFCYWHYWFGNGKIILEKPIQEVLRLKKPDVGFCFAWANQSWGGLDYGDAWKRILMEQVYPGKQDYIDHFNHCLPFFEDSRYTKINGMPIFQINHPKNIPDIQVFFDVWNELAVKNSFPGIYFIAHEYPGYDYKKLQFNGLNFITPTHLYARYKETGFDAKFKKIMGVSWAKFKHKKAWLPMLYEYQNIVAASNYSDLENDENVFPVAIPGWDHSPRSGKKATILVNNTPELFYKNLTNCWNFVKDRDAEKQIIFVKSWNEWAEGNILEPDAQNGTAYLQTVKKFVDNIAAQK